VSNQISLISGGDRKMINKKSYHMKSYKIMNNKYYNKYLKSENIVYIYFISAIIIGLRIVYINGSPN